MSHVVLVLKWAWIYMNLILRQNFKVVLVTRFHDKIFYSADAEKGEGSYKEMGILIKSTKEQNIFIKFQLGNDCYSCTWGSPQVLYFFLFCTMCFLKQQKKDWTGFVWSCFCQRVTKLDFKVLEEYKCLKSNHILKFCHFQNKNGGITIVNLNLL